MLVADKHRTVRRTFRRTEGRRRLYEIHESQSDVFGSSSLRNQIKILRNHDLAEVAARLDEATEDPNKNKMFCVTFCGGSHRKLLDHHDMGKTIGNYAISIVGTSFIRLSSRISRINIWNSNVNLEVTPADEPFVHLLRAELPVARKWQGNINLDILEFIQVHCGNTLTGLSVSAFDRGLKWSMDNEYQVERYGRAISAFGQLKSLDISHFECGPMCFEMLLRGIEGRRGRTTELEALDISHNDINLGSANIIKSMLISGKMLRLDATHITARLSTFDLYRLPPTSSLVVPTPPFPVNATPIITIIDGCCQSRTIGVVRMEYIMGCAVNSIYSAVVHSLESGKLRLFEFRFGKHELLSKEEKQTIIECRERNSERWMIARRLQANDVNMIEMPDILLRIKWDTSLVYDALRQDTSYIRSLFVRNEGAQSQIKEYPKRKTRTSLRAWKGI
jgi:hypothetical protein